MKKKDLRRTLKICGFGFVTLLIFASFVYSAPPADKGGGGGKGGGKAPGIALSAPTTAVAGQVVTLTVTPVNGAVATFVMIGANRGSSSSECFSTSLPFTCTYVIPIDVVGAVTVGATALDGTSNSVYEANVTTTIGTSATLTSMELRINTTLQGTWSQKMFFDYYMQPQGVSIVGTYSDGVTRDLSSPASGTVYTSQNTGVVEILPDGTFQAVGQGATTVTATNSGVSLTITATVDFVDPDAGSRCGGNCTGYDLAITYSDPVTLTPAAATPFSLSSSGTAFTLPTNATQMTFGFNNNSGLPQIGVLRGLATWKLAGGSDPNCSVSFANNVLPTDLPPYAVSRGKMTITLPPGGGKCVIQTNIEGLPDSRADKWTITNPVP